jgi:hypothetical protein
MGDSFCIRKIIDRHNVHIRILKGRSKQNPSNSSKTIYSQFNSHFNLHNIVNKVNTECENMPGYDSFPRIKLIDTLKGQGAAPRKF